MAFNILRAERTLSLLTSSYLANTEAVRANIGLVLDTVLSQNLFGSSSESGAPAEAVRRYDSAVHKWVVRIGSLATGKTPESRIAGILLMKHTAQQSPQIFIEHASKWVTSLLNILGKNEVVPVYSAAMETLLGFLDLVREVPALQREIANAQVPRMNQVVLALAEKYPELLEQIFDVLIYSVNWFPTLFRPSIDKSEALCLKAFSGSIARSSPAAVKQAANCFASLCQAGGKVSVEDRWFQYVQMAIGTIQSCVDHIMCVEADGKNIPGRQSFTLPAFSDDFMVSIPQAAERISSMADLLIALLGRPTNVDVSVPVDQIVAIASKLAFIPLRVANSKTDRSEFGLVPLLTPQIHRAAIRILASVAISLGDYVHPFLMSISRTVAAINSRHVASPVTQVALYSLVQLYTQRYSYGFIVCLPKEVIASVVGDINVHSRRRAVALGALPGSSSSKKRSGGGKSRASASSTAAENADGPAQTSDIQWTDVVYAALKAVQALLRHTPTALGPPIRAQIDSQILALLLLQAVNGNESPFASRQTDAAYRVCLYECLQASILSPDPWQVAILPHAVSVFTAGAADPSVAVQQICLKSLSAIEPIVHSRLPAQLRAPGTEEEADLSSEVAYAMRGGKTIDSLAVADSNSSKQSAERLSDGEDSEADAAGEAQENSAKRFKQSSAAPPAANNSSAPQSVQPTRLIEPTLKLQLQREKPKVAANKSRQTTQPAAMSAGSTSTKPTETLKPKPPSPSLLSGLRTNGAAPSAAGAAKKAQVEEAGGEDDDIPDIVMEGSDSEDE
ncbi:hypothetical protein GQ54DRAFT_295928 [Martensiomyces pterosporus]|nr:hypothetical protein GQ54DRAFT_295928 [Martensiomyces pterosporus]